MKDFAFVCLVSSAKAELPEAPTLLRSEGWEGLISSSKLCNRATAGARMGPNLSPSTAPNTLPLACHKQESISQLTGNRRRYSSKTTPKMQSPQTLGATARSSETLQRDSILGSALLHTAYFHFSSLANSHCMDFTPFVLPSCLPGSPQDIPAMPAVRLPSAESIALGRVIPQSLFNPSNQYDSQVRKI